MKKIICLISLLGVFALPYSCQSYQGDENIQRQEETEPAGDHLDRTVVPPQREFPEKGGNSSSK
jgi:hypothetical protein